MSTELSTYQRMPDPLAAVKEIGGFIARSGMFSCESEAQGQVFALHCMAKNRDPLSIIESYHLMHGKLTLKAEEMLARVVDDGGEYEIIEHSPNAAEIHIKYRGREFRERFTWEDAKLEPFVYQGKPKEIMPTLLAGNFDKLTLSTNYATPRRRMQHLWARVVSDAVRVVAPNLLRGKYTPEEMHQAAIDDGKIPPSTPMPEQSLPAAPAVEESVVDAEFETVAETQPSNSPPLATGEQVMWITMLFKTLNVPADAQLAAIKKRGAVDMGSLSSQGASDLIAALEAKLAVNNSVGNEPSKMDGTATSVPSDGPCSETQMQQVRTLIQQIAQTDGVGIPNRVKAALDAKGLKLADLTITECEELIAALGAKNIEVFFAKQLSKEAAKN